MKIIMQSELLGVIMGRRTDSEGKTNYLVVYGFDECDTNDFEVALERFNSNCTHSAECLGLMDN